MGKSLLELKSEAYDITKKMGAMQQEFTQLNEKLQELQKQITEAEKKPT
jgi:septation ring formation regulator EzrA